MNDNHVQSTETEDGVSTLRSVDASLFTFIPELYLVLSRLSALNQSGTASRTNGDGIHTQDVVPEGLASTPPTSSLGTTSVAGPQSLPPSNPLTHTISAESGATITRLTSAGLEQSIEIKDLPSHIYKIRQNITRAREAVKGLPDVDRTIKEQEMEVVQLQQRIASLTGRLKSLGSIARAKDADVAEKSMKCEQ